MNQTRQGKTLREEMLGVYLRKEGLKFHVDKFESQYAYTYTYTCIHIYIHIEQIPETF